MAPTNRHHCDKVQYVASYSHQDSNSPVSEPLDTEPSTMFSAAKEKLFQRQLEEGYNIPDAKYNEWLRMEGIRAD